MLKPEKFQVNRYKLVLLTKKQKLKETFLYVGFPGGSDDKESACNSGDLGSVPGLGGSPGEGSCSPLKYSSLENSIDRGAW